MDLKVGAMSHRTFKQDKKWSDYVLPEIKEILGRHLIRTADDYEDVYHNTDLTTLKLEGYRIGCRVRGVDYHKQYKHDFTMRYDRPNGNESEF